MLKYHNGHFPFADRFRDAYDQGPNWDAWDVPLYIPEWDLTVRRRLNGYCASSYRYYIEERVLYRINWREYEFLPVLPPECPYLYLPATHLYDERTHVFYWHLFFADRHYAVVPMQSEEGEVFHIPCGPLHRQLSRLPRRPV